MEFILNIEDAPFVNNSGKKLYKSADFETLVFDQKGLDKLKKYDRARHEAENATTKTLEPAPYVASDMELSADEAHGIGFNEGYEQGIQQGRKEMCQAVIKLNDAVTRVCTFGGKDIGCIFKLYKPETILGELAHFDKQKFDKDLSTLVEQYGYDDVTEVLRKIIESDGERQHE